MPTLVIANKVYSSWSMRPWLLMRHFEIAFDEVVVAMDGPTSKAEMLRHAPHGKCPSLRDGDTVVWESLAIVEYLAETYPDRPIWPRDATARAAARSLAAEMHAGFLPLRRALPMNMRRAPRRRTLDPVAQAEVEADVARIEGAWLAARAQVGEGGPFLFGAFSAADAMFAPVVQRFHAYDIPVEAGSRAYMASVMALPAWRAWEAEALIEGWHLARIDEV